MPPRGRGRFGRRDLRGRRRGPGGRRGRGSRGDDRSFELLRDRVFRERLHLGLEVGRCRATSSSTNWSPRLLPGVGLLLRADVDLQLVAGLRLECRLLEPGLFDLEGDLLLRLLRFLERSAQRLGLGSERTAGAAATGGTGIGAGAGQRGQERPGERAAWLPPANSPRPRCRPSGGRSRPGPGTARPPSRSAPSPCRSRAAPGAPPRCRGSAR